MMSGIKLLKCKLFEIWIHVNSDLFTTVFLCKCLYFLLYGYFFMTDPQIFDVLVFDNRDIDIQIRLSGILHSKLSNRVAVCYFAKIS